MKLETPCPACDKPVSMWRVMAAPTPWHVRCGACKASLRPVGATVPALIVAVVAGLAFTLATRPLVAAGEYRRTLLWGAATIVILELVLSFIIINWTKLEARR